MPKQPGLDWDGPTETTFSGNSIRPQIGTVLEEESEFLEYNNQTLRQKNFPNYLADNLSKRRGGCFQGFRAIVNKMIETVYNLSLSTFIFPPVVAGSIRLMPGIRSK
jgi:hypothetical protein